MKITFGIGLDGATYPDVLPDVLNAGLKNEEAVLGRLTVGEHGLLQLLETITGLKGPEVSPIRRVVRYHAALKAALKKPLFYQSAFEKDSLAVARDLLQLRDELRLAGWDGRAVSGLKRVEDLAEVEVLFADRTGMGDRLPAVESAIRGMSKLPIATLNGQDQRRDLPIAWQKVLLVLESKGVIVTEAPTKPKALTPFQADESRRLLQTSHPWMAADWLAASIAQLPAKEWAQTVIVAPSRYSELLAHAFTLRGIPFGGSAGGASLCRPALQILNLVMALAFLPQDPKNAKALLLIGNSPIWRKLAYRLAGALDQKPAIGSDAWNVAIERFMKEQEDKQEYSPAAVTERLDWVFTGKVSREKGITLTELEATLRPALEWLKNYGGAQKARSMLEAASIGREFLAVAKLLGVSPLSEEQLHSLFLKVAGSGAGVEIEPARAGGPIIVDAPEKVLAPAKNVIWWDFNAQTVRTERYRAWLADEVALLEKAGVRLTEAKAQSALLFNHWSRPIEAARESFLAVSFHANCEGEPESLHPVLDYYLPAASNKRAQLLSEITISPLGDNAATVAFKKQVAGAVKKIKVPEALPGQTGEVDWSVPKNLLKNRDADSPSSLSKLLGCSFAYALEYGAFLEGNYQEGLSEGIQLAGTLGHAVFERVFKVGKPPKQAQVRALTEEVFERVVAGQAQELLLEALQLEKMRLKSQLVQAAEKYCAFLEANDLEVVAVEETITGDLAPGIPISGRVDCILGRPGKPVLIVDYKWGGLSGRADELASGEAHQLYIYAKVAGGKKPLRVGYFIFTKGEALILNAEYALATSIQGEEIASITSKLSLEIEAAKSALEKGALTAPGITEEAPPCKWCDYSGICGRKYL